MKRPSSWLVITLVVAMLAFWLGPLRFLARGNDVPDSGAVALSIWLAWIWIGVLIAAIIFRGRRALWFLVQAPFVLYWPGMWIFVAHACSLLGDCSR
jgi:hypothetical protein